MKKIIIFIVCYLIGTIVYAQTPADSVPLDYNGLRETVYLQTSKGIYETGEEAKTCGSRVISSMHNLLDFRPVAGRFIYS